MRWANAAKNSHRRTKNKCVRCEQRNEFSALFRLHKFIVRVCFGRIVFIRKIGCGSRFEPAIYRYGLSKCYGYRQPHLY